MTIYNIVEKDKRFLVAPPRALHLVDTRLCDSLNILQTRALHLVRKTRKRQNQRFRRNARTILALR